MGRWTYLCGPLGTCRQPPPGPAQALCCRENPRCAGGGRTIPQPSERRHAVHRPERRAALAPGGRVPRRRRGARPAPLARAVDPAPARSRDGRHLPCDRVHRGGARRAHRSRPATDRRPRLACPRGGRRRVRAGARLLPALGRPGSDHRPDRADETGRGARLDARQRGRGARRSVGRARPRAGSRDRRAAARREGAVAARRRSWPASS